MSDSDERSDSERSEEEEEDERFEVNHHNRRLTAAQKWIKDVVGKREAALAEGTSKKVKLTEEDVDEFFDRFSDLTHDENENAPTVLHAIVDLVISNVVEASIDSATVKALVQRLVQQSTRLLCICNDEQQNPLYLAITKKKKILADYMVVSCPEDESHRQHLAKAIEDTRGNEKRKNCLHLAFEKDLKPTTQLRMVKDANLSALESVDSTGRRPMHYAVQYKHCNVDVIRAFIEKDIEALKLPTQASGNQPPRTFLDVDEEKKTKTSVYEEHVSSAEANNEEKSSKKGTSDYKTKKGESSTRDDDGGKHARDETNDAAQRRNQVTKSKAESQFEPKSGGKFSARRDEANAAASRDPRNPQDRTGRTRDRDQDKRAGDDSALTELEKKRERLRRLEAEARKGELGQPLADREASRDRQSVGPTGGRDSLRVQTTFLSAAPTNPSGDNTANTPKLRRMPTMRDDVVRDKSETRAKRTTTAAKKPRKSVDHEAAARDSKTIQRMLKLHYMRTRSIEKATSWLYKTNPQDVQTFFDYHKCPDELKEDLFEKAFQATRFDEVLQFVHFTNVTVIRRQRPNSKNERSRGGFGRRDMEFFFNFLYKKGVRYILKVVVDESVQSVHSDEAIKNALDKITVEHLDWRKVDLDPQLICGISSQAEDNAPAPDETELVATCRNQLRRLDLQWSGNSAVLRAWSELEGLPSLPHLEAVNLIVPEDTIMYDSPEWILEKKNEFEERLNKNCAAAAVQQEMDVSPPAPRQRKVAVNLEGVNSATKKKSPVGLLHSGSAQGRASQTVAQKVINTHEWLRCMDAFAKNINPLWTSARANFLRSTGAVGLGTNQDASSRPATVTGLENEIVVALIDDGVSLLDQNFVGRVLEGKTFDYSDGSIGQSYISAQGHGTEMARCILRVCPMAKIYPIRLKTQVSDDGAKSEINLKSAALAIRAALEKKAAIISMSWTIPVPEDPTPESELFESAVREACSRNVLMFCSSPDDGNFASREYPSAAQRDKIFRIGAAHDHGLAFNYTDKDVDFIFPGVQVNISAASPATGSSIATALAAGLAATIIYCFKISALAVKTQSQAVTYDDLTRRDFTESAVLKVAQHVVMKGAFGRIGRINEARFIQIWDELQPLVQHLEDPQNADDHNIKVGFIMNLCTKLA